MLALLNAKTLESGRNKYICGIMECLKMEEKTSAAQTLAMAAILALLAGCAPSAPDAEPSGGEFVQFRELALKLMELKSRQDALSPSEAQEDFPPARVSFEGSTVYFEGYMEGDAYRSLVDSVRERGMPLERIVVTSRGGDSVYGKLFGLWVYENALDVQVREICLSSCANYVFPAGKNKYVEENALVVWNGSVLSPAGKCSGLEDEEGAAQETGNRLAEKALEREFYGIVGVDPEIASCLESEEEGGTVPIVGSTLSIENMKRFGIGNVAYLGKGRYPERKEVDGGMIIEATGQDARQEASAEPAVAETSAPSSSIYSFLRSKIREIELGREALAPPDSVLTPGEAAVRFEDGTVYFEGYTEKDEWEQFIAAVRQHGQPLEKIVITSWGGSALHGKLFGLWVHENELDVQVREICFSSCANYVFPAGKNKYVEENSLVGWHGNVLQLAGKCSDSQEARDAAFEEDSRNRVFKGRENVEFLVRQDVYYHVMERWIEREFYRIVGVDPEMPNYPCEEKHSGRPRTQDEKDLEKNAPGSFILGTTFSIENMEHFGISNVTYLGEGRYPERKTINGEIILDTGVAR